MQHRIAVLVAVMAFAADAHAQPAPSQPANPAATEMTTARSLPGPIVNGRRRQPTQRELDERLRQLPEAQRLKPADAQGNAELDSILRSLNLPPAQ
jgi:hypothetical protein